MLGLTRKFGLRHGGCLAHARRKFSDLSLVARELHHCILDAV